MSTPLLKNVAVALSVNGDLNTDKEIHFIFVVDLYKEGVDIPELNTIIFLQPPKDAPV